MRGKPWRMYVIVAEKYVIANHMTFLFWQLKSRVFYMKFKVIFNVNNIGTVHAFDVMLLLLSTFWCTLAWCFLIMRVDAKILPGGYRC